jgi:hypothetical protein
VKKNHSYPESLRTVVARFSLEKHEVEKHYQRDECFRSICRDYVDACAALQSWQQKAGKDDRRTLDYRRLVDELELELLSNLKPLESQP